MLSFTADIGILSFNFEHLRGFNSEGIEGSRSYGKIKKTNGHLMVISHADVKIDAIHQSRYKANSQYGNHYTASI